MPSADTKAAKNTPAPKKGRRILTDEQRIAKLEADLKAAREKAQAKERKQINDLLERRKQLKEQVAARQAKVDEVDEKLRALGWTPEAVDVDNQAENVA